MERLMRLILLLCSLAMPVVSWLSQRGAFGPDNGTISDRYPTLLVAAGYAFAVWGLIFLLDVVFGIWQALPGQREDGTLAPIRPVAAAGFALTTVWMPLFSQQLFWLALAVIWASLACLLYCAVALVRDPEAKAWAWLPLSLHAGWLSLAAFLNTAQVVVAFGLLSGDDMLPWSLALFAAAAALLLMANRRMGGNPAYAAVALWGLAAVYVKQSQATTAGAEIAAWAAVAIGALLAGQTVWLLARRRARPAVS
jgi:hypothetical protein